VASRRPARRADAQINRKPWLVHRSASRVETLYDLPAFNQASSRRHRTDLIRSSPQLNISTFHAHGFVTKPAAVASLPDIFTSAHCLSMTADQRTTRASLANALLNPTNDLSNQTIVIFESNSAAIQ
ncbi:hypothetical protein WI845_16670, partial [Vibrio cholerae]